MLCFPADHAAQLALIKNSCSNFWDRLESECSYPSPRQGLGGAGRNDSRQQMGSGGSPGRRGSSGMGGEAVNFRGEEKIEGFSLGTLLQRTKSSMQKGKQKAALVPLITGDLGSFVLLIKKVTRL